jgi:hypothetical protein
MRDPQKIKELATQVTKSLSDQGQLIEGGWQGFALMVLPSECSETQRTEMRRAFYGGAHHLFFSILNILDRSTEDPSEPDLRRLELIHKELTAFTEYLTQEATKDKGSN